MKNAKMVDSLANTGVQYILGQARMYPDLLLHVQVRCDKINRAYGLAFNAKVDEAVREWTESPEVKERATIKSMHENSDARYFPVQLKVVAEAETFHVQIAGPTFNRTYGFSGDLTNVEEIKYFLE